MRFFVVAFLLYFFPAQGIWEVDFETARKKAETEHKLILLNFSGSDWCGPCIRLRKDIFESEAFQSFATNNLVLVNADFPRLKKNQLSKEQQKKNDKLADSYNPQGSFPYTLLLNESGKVLKTWEGYPDVSTNQFLEQVKAFTNDSN